MISLGRLLVKAANSRYALPLKDVARRLRETYYNHEVLHRIEKKTAPLKIEIDNDAPYRINIIIPEINFGNFYGGYIAKFNLAKKLALRGHNIRVITVDQCVYQADIWRKEISAYAGLEDVFDLIEVECCFDRRCVLRCHPKDGLIATTWWTAYIANSALKELEQNEFVYLIQEYEPFTFPMGSYFAAAEESYNFPHHALFSTRLLQEYFERHRMGGNAGANISANRAYFENAIIRFSGHELNFENRSTKRLLFYARPEAHATRNMFEIGYIALAKAIEQGVFDNERWEFYGIGSRHGDIELPKGHRLKMLGKVSLQRYRQLLPDHDLGLSLMYTPHPSLLPLEMAAAGMLVVTNECLNKTADELAAISANILSARPHVAGVMRTIKTAVDKISDYPARRHGANVNWANTWEQAFNHELLDNLEHWLGAQLNQ